MIREIWDNATDQAKETGEDPKDVYIRILENKLGIITDLRHGALKKVTDLLTVCSVMSLPVGKDDPAFELCRKIHGMACTILSTSEQKVANEVTHKFAVAKSIILQLDLLLKSAGVTDIDNMTNEEKFNKLRTML